MNPVEGHRRSLWGLRQIDGHAAYAALRALLEVT